TGGSSLVVQGSLPASGTVLERYAAGIASHVIDSYTIVLARPPLNASEVVISIDAPPGLVFVNDDGTQLTEKRKPNGTADLITLTFTSSDWYKPQTVYFKVDATLADIPDLGDLQHKVVATVGGETRPEIKSFATGGGN